MGLKFIQSASRTSYTEVVHGMFAELSQGIPRINSHTINLRLYYFSYLGHVGNKDQIPSQTISNDKSGH